MLYNCDLVVGIFPDLVLSQDRSYLEYSVLLTALVLLIIKLF